MTPDLWPLVDDDLCIIERRKWDCANELRWVIQGLQGHGVYPKTRPQAGTGKICCDWTVCFNGVF